MCSARAQMMDEKQPVLNVIHEFFRHLESQDSVAFRNLHVKNARFYIVFGEKDSVRTSSRDIGDFHFRKEHIIKERMREKDVVVKVQGRIATVWAPYDLWLNDKFSHCGVDVFTLLKTPEGWKIVTCSYTMEKEGCN